MPWWLTAVSVLGALAVARPLTRALSAAGYRLDGETDAAPPRWWGAVATLGLVGLVLGTAARFEVAAYGSLTAAYAVFALVTVALAWVDADVHRLPTGLVGPGLLAALAQLALVTVVTGRFADLLRALSCAVAMFLLHLLLAVVADRFAGGGFGGGDVNLAGLTGLVTGYLSWTAPIVALYVSFIGAGLYALIRLALRRGNRRTAIAFGPWMLAGAWVAILGRVPPIV